MCARRKKQKPPDRVSPTTDYGATGNHFVPPKPVPRPSELRKASVENGKTVQKRRSTSSLKKYDGKDQEASESSPLLQSKSVSIPPKPARVVPAPPHPITWTPPSPTAELLFAPSIQLKKATSAYAMSVIEEMEEPRTPRSATFHEALLPVALILQDEENNSEEEPPGSDDEDNNESGYQEFSGSARSLRNDEDFINYKPNHNFTFQPEILIDSPDTPDSKLSDGNFQALQSREYRVSQECLIMDGQDADISDADSDVQEKPANKRGAKKKHKNRQISSDISSDDEELDDVESSESTDTTASGFGAPEYQRLAESNMSVNRISDTEPELLDLR